MKDCHNLHLGHCYGVCREIVLVRQHGRVQILRAMGHEVEARHKQDHVNEEQPMLLEGHPSRVPVSPSCRRLALLG